MKDKKFVKCERIIKKKLKKKSKNYPLVYKIIIKKKYISIQGMKFKTGRCIIKISYPKINDKSNESTKLK